MSPSPATTSVPLVDLAWQHEEIAQDIVPRVLEVMATGNFIQGVDVGAFEAEFAAFCGVTHCVAVGNGTDALELALRASRVRSGSSVILPANTFVASAEAVVRAGCHPVLVDCDQYSLMDVDQLRDRLDERTGALMPVHLYGQMADMESLVAALGDHDVTIIEDAAQAQGATRYGRGIGFWGTAAGTSFYPGKNLGAYGDGGAVLTGDAGVARQVRLIANHGSESKYVHTDIGCNSRLDTLQAVVLRAKLARLADWNLRRRAAAARYDALLEPLSAAGLVDLPLVAPGNTHVWHLYVIEIANRDAVLRQLNEAGIGAGIHYPVPVHLQQAFRYLGYRSGDFPVAERAASRMLSLPLYPGITESAQERVTDAVGRALQDCGAAAHSR
jgi:dTDP-4-amino-4,6-dideoxygalactose transaminase